MSVVERSHHDELLKLNRRLEGVLDIYLLCADVEDERLQSRLVRIIEKNYPVNECYRVISYMQKNSYQDDMDCGLVVEKVLSMLKPKVSAIDELMQHRPESYAGDLNRRLLEMLDNVSRDDKIIDDLNEIFSKKHAESLADKISDQVLAYVESEEPVQRALRQGLKEVRAVESNKASNKKKSSTGIFE